MYIFGLSLFKDFKQFRFSLLNTNLRFRRFAVFVLLSSMTMILPCNAQKFKYDINFDGLFDNREFKGDMKPQTIFGMRLAPEIGIEKNNSRLMLGLSKVWQFGSFDETAPQVILYYSYQKNRFSGYFGEIPRMKLQRQLPDAFLYDSIAFFDNRIEGLILGYQDNSLSAEVYCNWFSKQSETKREAFRIVGDGFLDKGFLSAGWFVALTHYAKPSTGDYHIYEKFSYNPYIRFNLKDKIPESFNLTIDAGILGSCIRNRAEKKWYYPIGFSSIVDAGWKFVSLKNTTYCGDAQQRYLNDSNSGIDFHRSDPFYNHSFYNRTDMNVGISLNNNTDISFTWSFHFTPDTPVHNQQLIKVKFRFNN